MGTGQKAGNSPDAMEWRRDTGDNSMQRYCTRSKCVMWVLLGLFCGVMLWGGVGRGSVIRASQPAVEAGRASRPDTNLHLHTSTMLDHPSDPVTVGTTFFPVMEQPFSSDSDVTSSDKQATPNNPETPGLPLARAPPFSNILTGLQNVTEDLPSICYPSTGRYEKHV